MNDASASTTATAVTPDHFFCPLTLEVMKVPFRDSTTGQVFERHAILEWIWHGENPTCPLTRKPLHPSNFQIDHELQLEIIEWEWDQEDQVKAAQRRQRRSSAPSTSSSRRKSSRSSRRCHHHHHNGDYDTCESFSCYEHGEEEEDVSRMIQQYKQAIVIRDRILKQREERIEKAVASAGAQTKAKQMPAPEIPSYLQHCAWARESKFWQTVLLEIHLRHPICRVQADR